MVKSTIAYWAMETFFHDIANDLEVSTFSHSLRRKDEEGLGPPASNAVLDLM